MVVAVDDSCQTRLCGSCNEIQALMATSIRNPVGIGYTATNFLKVVYGKVY